MGHTLPPKIVSHQKKPASLLGIKFGVGLSVWAVLRLPGCEPVGSSTLGVATQPWFFVRGTGEIPRHALLNTEGVV
ncbi:hypothetical protein [Photobacterium lutimaris]|uniref:Uncharacterized protein n=1 Tax=Photobacterium lutimaris TaxID=388278 RepID=A0A2T3IWU6_9GAMM|nr:hypothetical protein [Photobacterium lutimaris]PSU32966.1 hypothetical protein C9I99_15280 [Photobacterium lutimaris]TDR74048.1 hypothetical protein DFP78_109107 [Photobacterium lutimaris]